MSFRVSTRFKALLEVAAARERRSQTNMLESLLYQYCDEHSITVPEHTTAKEKLTEGQMK
ncbi:hypothetical protein F3K36_11550 [Delftia sp. BR1]|nr:hypothetical protein F3K36_11550 [Delftia sp. BR1]